MACLLISGVSTTIAFNRSFGIPLNRKLPMPFLLYPFLLSEANTQSMFCYHNPTARGIPIFNVRLVFHVIYNEILNSIHGGIYCTCHAFRLNRSNIFMFPVAVSGFGVVQTNYSPCFIIRGSYATPIKSRKTTYCFPL